MQALLILAAAGVCAFTSLTGPNQIWRQVVCLVAALAVVAPNFRDGRLFARIQGSRLFWEAVLVVLAIGLRMYVVWLLPSRNLAVLEELQTGGIAYSMVHDPHLDLEFRFTNALAAIGFWSWVPGLTSLRSMFFVTAAVSLIFLSAALRVLELPLPVRIATLIGVATSPWYALTGSVADEIGSSTWLVCAIIFLSCLLVKNRMRPYPIARWLGLLSGVLFYEYIGFRIFIGMAVAVAVMCAWTGRPRSWKAGATAIGGFVLPFALVVFPAFVYLRETGDMGGLFEGVFRHQAGRPGLFSPEAYGNLLAYMGALFGVPRFEYLMLSPPAAGVREWYLGLWGLLSVLVSLARVKRPLLVIFSWTVVASIVSAAIAANNIWILRMTAVLPLVSVLTAVCVTDFVWRPLSSTLGRFAHVPLVATCIILLSANFGRVYALRNSLPVLLEYENNPYMLAHFLGHFPPHGSHVTLVVPAGEFNSSNEAEERWLWDPFGISIDQTKTLPAKLRVRCGECVVVDLRQLAKDDRKREQLRQALEKAPRLQPLTDLRNAAGVPVAVGVCGGC